MAATDTINIQDMIAAVKASAKTFLETHSLPSNREEEWRFSAVRKYFGEPVLDAKIEATKTPVLPPYFHQCVGTKLVLINGVLDEKLSKIESDGFSINLSMDALSLLGTAIVEPNFFTAFNTAHFNYGLTIEIIAAPKNPIHIFHLVDSPTIVLPRVLVVAKANSTATINELYFNQLSECKVASVMEVFVEKNATLYFNHVATDNPKLALINTLETHCERDAHFYHSSYSTKNWFVRNNTHIRLNAENSYGSLAGFYATTGESLTDNHVLIDHRKPNCESFQLFKGLLDDQSTGVFNGKIMVHIDAQKTNAFQSSKAILLSDEATVNSKPQLEIFADDVKCSHGAAIGQMNKNEIFYFKARGIDEATAKAILNLAYTTEVLEKINDETLRNYLLQSLKDESDISY